jgi:SAM-dependent methyltransferase
VKIVTSYGDEIKILEEHIRAQGIDGRCLQILEAGCGREWYFHLAGLNYELTGLDLDPAALKARMTIKGDMTHSFVGDLRTADLPSGYFDVIYNAFVLEHIEGAETALVNFVRWLKPGGLLIIRVPDRDSVQGFLARFTPHWFHVFYYRWAWKVKDAGKPGFAPYRTIYDPVVSRAGLCQFCVAYGLDVADMLGVGTFRRGYGLASRVTPIIAKLVSLFTLGRVHSKFVDLTIVARKQLAG